MKNVVLSLLLGLFLSFGAGYFSGISAQDTGVADSLSIDDMDPVLYHPEEEEEPQTGNTGIYIGIAIVVVAAGVIVFKVVGKKK